VTIHIFARQHPGTAGYLAFLGWTLLMVALLPAERLPWLGALILLCALTGQGNALSMLASWRMWAMLLSLIIISPFLLGEPDIIWGGLGLSSEGFWMGVWMALRALCISLAFSISIGALSVSQLTSLFERAGIKGLGFALGVALNMMSLLGEVVSVTYHTCRLRGGFRRRVWANSRRMLIDIITSALRHGDDVVLAASVRAFDPDAENAPVDTSVSITRADIVLIRFLSALTVLFVLI